MPGWFHAAESPAAAAAVEPDAVTLTAEQARTVKVAAVEEHDFVPQHETEGFIDFNEDRSVQVFSPWQGRIARVLVRAGDDVKAGDALFTIASADLVAAESNLIAAAGVLQLTTRALERARAMFESQSIAQKDLDQAASDQQTSQANLEAARTAVRIFGKSDAEIDRIIASRSTGAELRIASPIGGRVIARNAATGALALPGNAPAPFTVADLATMWLVANVTEDELPHVRLGQPVEVSLAAFPDRQVRRKHQQYRRGGRSEYAPGRGSLGNAGSAPRAAATDARHLRDPYRRGRALARGAAGRRRARGRRHDGGVRDRRRAPLRPPSGQARRAAGRAAPDPGRRRAGRTGRHRRGLFLANELALQAR